ncbi:MAG: hypothetical protein ACM3O6_09585 [Acidobacteriota bacterium]
MAYTLEQAPSDWLNLDAIQLDHRLQWRRWRKPFVVIGLRATRRLCLQRPFICTATEDASLNDDAGELAPIVSEQIIAKKL